MDVLPAGGAAGGPVWYGGPGCERLGLIPCLTVDGFACRAPNAGQLKVRGRHISGGSRWIYT